MDFFGRTTEIGILRRERELSHKNARFTVVSGRRRIGKTELIGRALDDNSDDYLYLLFGRKNEKALCRELVESAELQLGGKLPPLGSPERLSQLLRVIVQLALERPLTLVLDEFQEMDFVNPGFYSELQGIWDGCHTTHKLNLVVSGSINRLMNKVMFNAGAPLFGRQTAHLRLRPFTVAQMKDILGYFSPNFCREDLLDFWAVTGGVARYVALLIDSGAVTRERMLEEVFSEASPFIDEGRLLLSQEFGGDSANYFSVLSSIASGHTRYSEIESDLGIELGSFLPNLERNYNLVRKLLPVFATKGVKNAVYQIEDPFYRFWFRFIARNSSLVEMRRFGLLRARVAQELDAFSGFALERYFRWKFAEESSYDVIGSWWDRKGENEIDLVCEDGAANRLDFYEVKRDPARYDEPALRRKVERFLEKHPEKSGRDIRLSCLSLKDM